MSSELVIHGYSNNGPLGTRPRQPLVHIMYSDDYRELQSLSFHPDDAPRIVAAITRAANAAKAGRKIKAIEFNLMEHS